MFRSNEYVPMFANLTDNSIFGELIKWDWREIILCQRVCNKVENNNSPSEFSNLRKAEKVVTAKILILNKITTKS